MTQRQGNRHLVSSILLLAACISLLQACSGASIFPSKPPAPIDFARTIEYADRAALVYESTETIEARNTADHRYETSPLDALGGKVFLETDDARHLQWIAVRGTANLNNIKLDVDYNKVVDERLRIHLHKGFADLAMDAYRFVKPRLKQGYEVRVTGHSLGGAAAVIVLMLLKEDGATLGQAVTFGQPKVTNRAGVRKYQELPLLRVINDKDPVPLLPPLELFAILDEGSFRHLGPEVVLEDGAAFRYYNGHDAERMSVMSFWQHMSDHDVPDHYMKNYLDRLHQKLLP